MGVWENQSKSVCVLQRVGLDENSVDGFKVNDPFSQVKILQQITEITLTLLQETAKIALTLLQKMTKIAMTLLQIGGVDVV